MNVNTNEMNFELEVNGNELIGEERRERREKRNKRKTDMNINEKVDKTVICKEVSLTNI